MAIHEWIVQGAVSDDIAKQRGYIELIRCKDCKHGEKTPTFQYHPNLTWCNKYERSHDDDWFCADAERIEKV